MRFYRLANVDGAANRRSNRRRVSSIAQKASSIFNLRASRKGSVNRGPESENRDPRKQTR